MLIITVVYALGIIVALVLQLTRHAVRKQVMFASWSNLIAVLASFFGSWLTVAVLLWTHKRNRKPIAGGAF